MVKKEKMNGINKKGIGDIRLLLGVIIVMIGSVGLLLWGAGFALNNSLSSFIGRLILATISIVILIIERIVK